MGDRICNIVWPDVYIYAAAISTWPPIVVEVTLEFEGSPSLTHELEHSLMNHCSSYACDQISCWDTPEHMQASWT